MRQSMLPALSRTPGPSKIASLHQRHLPYKINGNTESSGSIQTALLGPPHSLNILTHFNYISYQRPRLPLLGHACACTTQVYALGCVTSTVYLFQVGTDGSAPTSVQSFAALSSTADEVFLIQGKGAIV